MRADLMAVADCQNTLNTLAARIDKQYHKTNQRILASDNPHVHFRKDGSFYVRTPKAESEDSDSLLNVLPQRRYISLLEVLATVNRFTNFLDAFEPCSLRSPTPGASLGLRKSYGLNILVPNRRSECSFGCR